MLAGQPPFAASTVDGLVRQHLLASPQRVRLVRPTVSREVEVIVQRALAKAPADRFVTAAALSAAVAGVLGSGGTIGLHERGHSRKRRRSAAALGIAAALSFAAIVTISLGKQDEEEFSFSRTAVAVLPFRNLSADSAHAYFAAGLHEELVTHFAKILSLSVRGRASSLGYAGSRKSISEIANDLRVGSVVEGSVQVVGDRLRVNVQLIDAATEEHVWADSYDRTLDDVFLVQSDVVRNIVGAVGGVLRNEEQQALARAPTQNAEAYRLYLQGREYDSRPGRLRHNWEIAQQLYERALAIDPGFALAHAALSMVHGRMNWWRYDPSPERSARQRKEAEEALRIDPALPEAHIAMGAWHYNAQRNYQAALGEYETALQRAPGDVELVESIAAVHRRLGRWRAVEEGFQRAVELDPRNADTFFDIGANTYLQTRRYEDAVDASNRALELAPDFIGAAVRKGWSYALWQGQLDTLRAVLHGQRREEGLGPYGTVAAQRAFLLLFDHKPAEMIAHLDSTEASLLEGYDFYYPKGLWYAWAHELLKDDPAAQLAYQSAMTFIDSAHQFFPDDPRIYAARGLALAGLNRRAEARRDAFWLEKSRYVREDALLGPVLDYDRCLVLAGIGEVQAALDGIEGLLNKPARTSIHTLSMDPRWDPLREHPRFRQLLVQFASR
jgi:serine/threonine-protein kinase